MAQLSAFFKALIFVLRWEGGYHHDKDDRGGATNKGVTQRVYNAWRRKRHMPIRSVKFLDTWEMRQLYRVEYWNKARCDKLPDKLAFVQFGTAVNMGVGRASRFLQRTVGAKIDGAIGPKTLAAVRAATKQPGMELCCAHNYCGYRREFYHTIAKRPKQKKYLKGWLNRLNALRKTIGLHAVKD